MNYDKVLQGILDVGEEMVVAGAEVHRVEDSIERMCAAYRFERVNVFIIVSNLQVTVQAPDGRIITHIRTIVRNDVNFDRMDYLNDLSRYICANTPDVIVMQTKLFDVMGRKQQPQWMTFLGSILAASGFTVFFGGTPLDAGAAAFMALLIVCLQMFLQDRENNSIVYNLSVSFVAGLAAILMVRIGMGEHADIIMMGGIMLLIPGIAMTNAIRDMLMGDTASGLLRLFNSLLTAAAIACGFALSIVVMGGAL
jgi:uncharacterized membrane protein YjjP (DUF1212 family)